MMQEFVQQIENIIREASYDIHTALPGTISEFDPSTGMAVVKPEGTIKMGNGRRLKYPSIVKVPVIFPQAAEQKIAIAYPVKAGDGCMIIVCENDLKPWSSNGQETDSNMKFDLTNAVCIPGLYSKGNEAVQKAVDEDAIILKNEEMEVMLKKDELLIEYGEKRIRLDEKGIRLECGEKNLLVKDTRIEIKGDLFVQGSIIEGGA